MKDRLTEQVLHEEIDKYTKRFHEMPTQIAGTYLQLLPISNMPNYVTDITGKRGFLTGFGLLELRLDPDADEWYLN